MKTSVPKDVHITAEELLVAQRLLTLGRAGFVLRHQTDLSYLRRLPNVFLLLGP